MGNQSADEVLDNKISIYGEGLGTFIYHLHNEWCDLFITWKQYENLFVNSKERVDLINKHGGGFFFVVERNFWSKAIIQISGLIGKTKGSLTIRHLPKKIEKSPQIDKKTKMKLISKIKPLIDVAIANENFLKERRDNLYAHVNYSMRTKQTNLKETASVIKIRSAIFSIVEPIRFIIKTVEDADSIPTVITGTPNEISLLYSLYDASRWDDYKRAKMKENWRDVVDKGLDTYPDWLQSQNKNPFDIL